MKLLLVCTSGGHFATMKSLNEFWASHDRVWVTDYKKDTSWLLDEKEEVNWLPYQAPRDYLQFARNLPSVIEIVRQEKADLIVSTGASIAVSFAIAAKLLGKRFVYVESISRYRELSLSGRLIYPIASEFYVQWPELTQRYPRAKFSGYAM